MHPSHKRQVYPAVAEQRASRFVRAFRAVGVRFLPTAGYFSNGALWKALFAGDD
jgi:hypothetical protein